MTSTELQPYKQYHQMSKDEKRNWRALNRRKFGARGFAGITAGSGMLTAAFTFASGYSLDRILFNVAAVEFIEIGVLTGLIGVFHVLIMAPWED